MSKHLKVLTQSYILTDYHAFHFLEDKDFDMIHTTRNDMKT